MKATNIKLNVTFMLISFLAMLGLAVTTLYCMATQHSGTVFGALGVVLGFFTLFLRRNSLISRIFRAVYCAGFVTVCLLTFFGHFADYTDICMWTTFMVGFLFFDIVAIIKLQTYAKAVSVQGEIVVSNDNAAATEEIEAATNQKDVN